tara:strand:- start:216 stop:1379 length:1164 start_codon:yes stop_codon:yes gene_type:complete
MIQNEVLKKLEESTQQCKELEEIKTKQFENFKKIIHDIKHPIHEIVCLLHVMKFENDKNSFETYSCILHEIAKTLIGRIDTIKDMNSLLTIESLTLIQTNLFVFFNNTFQSMSYLFQITDSIEFNYNIDLPNDLIMNFDEDKYRRCLENLVSNSIKYTSSGNIDINVYIKNSHLYTSIEDSGKGIPCEKINQVLNGEQLQNGMGNGYGFPFVVAYVKLFNGTLNIESEEFVGTKITFSIPIEINEETIINVDINSIQCKKYKMLLVDDCPISRNIVPKLINNVAKSFDIIFDVTTSHNGETGLKLLKNEHFDLIFSDYWMPVMDGETMLNKFILHNKFITKPNKFILKLYSANLFEDNNRPYEVLKKPLTHNIIENVIKEFKQKIEY